MTSQWTREWRHGRIEVGLRVYRHSYSVPVPDRWVIKPWLTYDRRDK